MKENLFFIVSIIANLFLIAYIILLIFNIRTYFLEEIERNDNPL